MSVPWYLMAKGKGGGGYKTASGPIVSVNDALAAPLRSLIANIDPVQAGSGDPSPDNVRPISGWSAVNVWRTGKNLFDKTSSANGKWLSTTTGLEEPNGNYCVTDYIPVMAGRTVFIPDSGSARRWFYDRYKNPATYLNNSGDDAYTPTADGYIRVTIAVQGTYAKNLDTYQIELGSTATAYAPYSGNEHTIQLGQTVYGGTLNVTNGVLTVDRAYVDIKSDYSGTINQNSSNITNTLFDISVPNAISVTNTDDIERVTCDRLSPSTAKYMISRVAAESAQYKVSLISNSRLYVCLPTSTVSTTAAFITWLTDNPLQVCYELSTPITIPLTPQEISTLQGQNNVWADSGDITIEYLASGGVNADLMKLAVAFMGRK